MNPMTIMLHGPDTVERAGLQKLLREQGLECVLESDMAHLANMTGYRDVDAILFMEHAPHTQICFPALPPPAPPLLIWGALDDPMHACRWLQAGASAYIHRSEQPPLLLDAVRRVVEGEKWLSPALGAAMVMRDMNCTDARAVEFTPRQEEVLRLMVRGLKTGAIAAELGLAPRTVRQHLRAAYDKMGVEDRWQALEWLSKRGWDE